MHHGHLCHITTAERIAAASGRVSAEPFLHCCTDAQLAFVLRRHFANQTGLLLLRFDPAEIEGEIRWERSEPDQDPFPHLYGALPLAAATLTPLEPIHTMSPGPPPAR